MRLSIILLSLSVLLAINCSNSEKPSQKMELASKNNPKKDTIKTFKSPYTLNEVLGKFTPSTHIDFVKIDKKHADKSMYLRKAAYEAFIKMHDAAKKDGLSFIIRSATRNFKRQKQIWEAKWTGSRLIGGRNIAKTISDPIERALKILEFSSMPGTSRHHWGTDIDLNAFENSYFEKGKGKKEYDWLLKNASNFGFCQPYTKKDRRRPNGYQEEKWHWTYMPISEIFTIQAKLELTNDKIVGFKGSSTAAKIDVVKNYVLGVNLNCK